MTTRTTPGTVTFRRPFVLAGFGETLPEGTYHIETDEERIDGLSFDAYRRTVTSLRLPAKPGRGLVQTLTLDPNDLDAALARDRAPAEEAPPAGPPAR